MTISEVQSKCIQYMEERSLCSFDLYDALTNPVLNKISGKNNLLRRVLIQINSKSPVDLHWLGMKKMVHTKTISDLLWYYSVNSKIDKEKINHYFQWLVKIKNTKGFGWGLNFPYTSRFINADADMPNLYNTINSGISICYAYPYLNEANKKDAYIIINGILHFLDTELGFVNEGTKGWYLYYPGQKYPTYNVNALTLYFLAFVKSMNINIGNDLDEKLGKIINLLVDEQEEDGSWFYSRSPKGKWVDGFHSAFVVESIAFAYQAGINANQLQPCLKKGINFYITEMFTKDGYPKYFKQSDKYPLESQNIAQSIQTLSLLNIWTGLAAKNLLSKNIDIALTNLYDDKGFFYHKKTRFLTYKKPYFRWSVTPMILALEYAKKSLNIT